MKFLWLCLCVMIWIGGVNAQDGHQLRFKVEGYDEPDMYLAYYMAESQFLLDTVQQDAEGYFTFAGEEELPGGVYLVVMAPDNQFFQIMVSPGEQHFSLETKKEDTVGAMRVKGSPDNKLYYEYLNYLNKQRPLSEKLREELAGATDAKKRQDIEEKISALDEKVLAKQQEIVQQHPQTLTAMLLKANLPLDTPEFADVPEEERQIQRWRWTQKHFFDKLDFSDERILRSPILWQRLDYYINKLTVQHPDTIADALVYILNQMQPTEELFKYYLIRYLNDYAKSEIVGMDGVYVRLVDEYYAKGLAPWTSEDQLAKIVENANTLKPLLIGQKAPDLLMQTRTGEQISLHGVDADFTVLYFWRFDCGHCKKSTPHLKEFYEQYKDKNVKIFAVCAKTNKEIPECWEYVDDNEIGDWIQVVDPFLRSRYNKIYDIKSTPQIYVLDRDKTIVSKRIGATQLGDVIDHLIDLRSQEQQGRMLNNK